MQAPVTAALISPACRCPASISRTSMTTVNPARANSRAVTAPMPCVVPVMTATGAATPLDCRLIALLGFSDVLHLLQGFLEAGATTGQVFVLGGLVGLI